MVHVVLFQPEIPQNTGNVGRLCAFTCTRLHLIHPLGFEITDRNLRRAGMDYWYSLDVHEHENWDAFVNSPVAPKRLWLFTTHAKQEHWDAEFSEGDGLVFGRETAGAPAWLHEQIGPERSLTLRKYDSELRSLNLSTSVGIATYEALRQLRG
ncbi:MAG: tRNA (cytidine(34)-2'-O)-methyltransferase [Myxococcota bacterium]